ncbi:hypothetical protein [Bacillus sonorensis]|uniref:hypothetical protein n=1 Tax=Bacillus sonorensis TaxID=119858 RepID=UPI0015C36CF4|nr:hypothetical protein [Bacillus sonorensis]
MKQQKLSKKERNPVSYWKAQVNFSMKKLAEALDNEAKGEVEEKRQIEKMING